MEATQILQANLPRMSVQHLMMTPAKARPNHRLEAASPGEKMTSATRQVVRTTSGTSASMS